ncbi:MAG: TolC family protein [Treponema sp.]|nr:TolC family protein [Treponema sp.]
MQNKNRIKNTEVSLKSAKTQLLQAIGCTESQLPGYPSVEFSQSGLYMEDLPAADDINEELIDYVFSNRNDLAAIKKSVDSAELKLKIEKANYLPDLNVGLSLGTTGTSYANDTSHFFTSGMDNVKGVNVTGNVSSSIKLGNKTKRGAVDKAQADYDIACAELNKARNDLKLELTNAAENIGLYKTMIEDSKTVLELQKSFYENEQKRFTAGYITVDNLIQQDQNYLEAQISYYQSLASYLNSVLEYKYYSAQMLTLQ